MMAAAPATEADIRGLTYRYPGSQHPALREVTMQFEPGLTAVAGPSGGGKSTLLRLLNGLVPHFHGGTIRGEVHTAGLDALRTPTATLARDVGFVFQDPEAQFVRGVVEDEVAFALENVAAPRQLIRGRVEEAMAAAGISGLAGRAIASLSGGERQRVAIASAIALRPRILALDEPTSQLDRTGAALVLEACAGLAGAGTTVVVSEHRVSGLLALADHLAVVDSGLVHGPGPVRPMLGKLVDPPALVALARELAWDPAPLSVDDARPLAPGLRRRALARASSPADLAWELRGCDIGPGGSAVLQGVELAGRSDEVTVLVGPNGGGKTTLLRAIAGLLKPLAGRVWRIPGRVAYLPQDPGVLLHRGSIRHEVAYTLRRAGSRQSADALLARLGLAQLSQRYPGDLSSGQRQRAALAVILAGEPAIVLLDEPTRGMDAPARQGLSLLLREMAASGASVVLATHDADLAGALADRVVTVDGGAARDAGPPDAALSGESPYATDIGRLYPGGPVTVSELLRCL
jgi:energy-coupling factor transport system ATP-binding protein